MEFVIGVLSSVTAAAIVGFVLWAMRHWLARELEKINWKLSGSMWWLACDLPSIKLLADLDHFAKMRVAMDNSFGHAQALHMDKQVLSGIRKLKSTFYSKEPLTKDDKTEIREQVDAVIDYCGKLAIKNQPDFKP